MNLLDTLTVSDLVSTTSCTVKNAERWLPYFKAILPSFGIVTKYRIAGFISQCAVESAAFSALSENLNYSATGLANTWPARYAAKNILGKYVKTNGKYTPNSKALSIARNPVLIANHCYANRMGNGSEDTGDGWKYRGRGLKQVTGKSNYKMITDKVGVDFVNYPDKLLEEPYALLSACVFWQTNSLGKIADTANVEALTKAINGGTNGLASRKLIFDKLVEVLDARERTI